MLLLIMALYLTIACLFSWILLFPTSRTSIVRILASFGAQVHLTFTRLARKKNENINTLRDMARISGESTLALVRHHYLIFIFGTLLITAPTLLVWMSSGKNRLDGYDIRTHDINSQIAALLQGEQLVPPVALPPMIFATQEVQQIRPMLVSASRNWALLNPDFTQRLLYVFKIMKEKHGYDMVILEGYRSPERQDLLASMGSNVTNAAAFESWHQYGLAADCAFLRNGKLVISEKDPWAMRGYELYGEVAESVGFTWGGRWKMLDFGHAEWRLPGIMKPKERIGE